MILFFLWVMVTAAVPTLLVGAAAVIVPAPYVLRGLLRFARACNVYLNFVPWFWGLEGKSCAAKVKSR